MYTDGRYLFRTAETDDVKALWEMEKICFPKNEANSFEDVKDRVEKATEDYLIAFDQVNGKIAGYLSGIHSSSDCFLDKFFTDASLHEKGAKHCYLLSLEVLPEYRGKGIASKIMERYLKREEERGTEKVFLTCHAHYIPFYEDMGFEHIGTSSSVWGGETWEDMVYRI